MPIISGGGGGGGSGTVTSVSSADTSIAVATGTTTPVLTAAALNTIAGNHATSGDVAMNGHKLTGLAAGTAAGNSVRYEQLPVVILFDSTLGGSAANFDITSIPATYNTLQLVYQLVDDDASQIGRVLLRFNGDSGGNYDYQEQGGNNMSGVTGATSAATSMRCGVAAGSGSTAGEAGSGVIIVPNYASTTLRKNVTATCGVTAVAGTVAQYFVEIIAGSWRNTAAVNEITLLPGAGSNFLVGSRVTLYGIL